MIKITAIKTFPVRIENGNQLIIKIETDQKDIYGWGASGLSGRELAVVGAVKHYANFIIGKDPRRIGALWQQMYRSQYFEGGRVLTAAISAIDIALHDIKGKLFEVPVYELLGGKQREFIECFASLKFDSKEELISKAHTLKKAGFTAIRLYEASEGAAPFVARESMANLVDWLPVLRKEMGNVMTIGLDYHHRLTVSEVTTFMNRIPAGTIDFLEEPIRDENPQVYQQLRQMINVPLALGEEFASKWQFWPYIKDSITQYARIDVCNVGGLTEAMKVVAMAETNYIDVMPHNPLGPICTAATIHMLAASSNVAWLEEINTPVEWCGTNSEKFYPVQPKLEGARYKIPETPGLGVEFNEDLASELSFEMKETPHLFKKDGSFTNW
ncbi:mandelate racemase/muconate lactonizing enzyme family protein [Aquimarina agarivorans]|uniref:mandelate racemase/muconate lactonizing enzyme family protein n=1 Tax=Aquimarina agarivorans TaxID=980584 RepID=UPI000248FC92|nr:mandelate racemase/muconate lactonizing enzyme family protein [Aquimarina agarivorans]